MADIIVQGKQYNNVPAVNFPKVGGGFATYSEGGGGAVAIVELDVTQNGTYNAPMDTAYDPVVVNVTPVLQSKTVTPSQSEQYVTPDVGYDGLSSVTVNQMPSGSASAPATISGSSASISTGTNTITLAKTVSVTPVVSAGYVSSGTATNSSVSLSASVTTKSATTYTPTTSDQTIASGTYLTGEQTISGDANLVSGNIKVGVSIFGVAGSLSSATFSQDPITKVLSIS